MQTRCMTSNVHKSCGTCHIPYPWPPKASRKFFRCFVVLRMLCCSEEEKHGAPRCLLCICTKVVSDLKKTSQAMLHPQDNSTLFPRRKHLGTIIIFNYSFPQIMEKVTPYSLLKNIQCPQNASHTPNHEKPVIPNEVTKNSRQQLNKTHRSHWTATTQNLPIGTPRQYHINRNTTAIHYHIETCPSQPGCTNFSLKSAGDIGPIRLRG